MTFDTAKRTQSRLIEPDEVSAPVFVLSDRYSSLAGPWHSHRRMQLVHVSEGVLTVMTRERRFVLPPERAVWIEAGTEHRIAANAPFWLTTCYLEPERLTVADPSLVVAVDPLTDELLIAASSFGPGPTTAGPQERLMAVLMDRLPELRAADAGLPEPAAPRLRRITDLLFADPARSEPLAVLADTAGMTERSAARLFVKDTGMTFGRWRQWLRLQVALEKLGGGSSVTATAFDVGYQDVSSFIVAFKARFGMTPARCFSHRPGRIAPRRGEIGPRRLS